MTRTLAITLPGAPRILPDRMQLSDTRVNEPATLEPQVAPAWRTGDAALDSVIEALPREVDSLTLRAQVLRATSKRGVFGAPIYLVVWLLITEFTGVLQTAPLLTWTHAMLFGLTMVSRILLARSMDRLLPQRYPLASTLFVGLTLLNAFHWGALTAYIGLTPELAHVERYMFFSVVGLTMAGTMGMAIHPVVRTAFPLAIVLPLILTLPLNLTADRILLAALGGVFALYVVTLSALVQRDYWRLLTASALLKRRARQLTELSHTDGLTGLRNRLYFDRQYRQEWLRAYRQRQPIAVMLLDLDHFKAVNDEYGHPFGDECLRAVARMLGQEVHRAADVAARFGGEEFIVMLVDTDTDGARAVADRVLAALRRIELRAGSTRVTLTASIGIASEVPQDPNNAQRLVQQADIALYRAKHGGRDQAVTSAWASLHDDDLRPG